jgi:hypothetical protein
VNGVKTMKRKSTILIGSAIVVAALLIALFLARKQFVGGPGSPTVEGSRAVTDGGIKIPGWHGRVDAAEEKAGMTLDAARLVEEGQALHVTTGPATSYWKTDATTSGDFSVKATFNERKYMNLNSHPHPYGVFIGGNDMGTSSQTELYCAASGNGKFIVRGFGPQPFRMNGLFGESNTVIHKAGGRGQPVTQDISLSVKGDKVICSINGSIVASYDKGALVRSGKLKSTNGYYGLRFAHNTDVFVSGLVMSTN